MSAPIHNKAQKTTKILNSCRRELHAKKDKNIKGQDKNRIMNKKTINSNVCVHIVLRFTTINF